MAKGIHSPARLLLLAGLGVFIVVALVLWNQGQAHDGARLVLTDNGVTVSEQSSAITMFGGDLNINARNAESVRAAGGNIRLRGTSRGDVSLAGGDVLIDATIGGRLRAAAGDLIISPRTTLAGDARLAAGDAQVNGRIDGDLRLAAGSAFIDAVVRGNVVSRGGSLRLGPGAVIHGSLRHRGPDAPVIAPGAVIHGGVIHDHRTFNRIHAHDLFGLRLPHGTASSVAGAIFMGIWAFVLGAALLLVFPGLATRTMTAMKARPFKSLLVGVATLVILPIAVVVLLMTIIGIPIALMLIFAYPFLFLLGYLGAALGLSYLLTRRDPASVSRGAQLGYLAFALAVLIALSLIPVIGGVLVAVLWLMGVGAFCVALFGRRNGATISA